MSALTIDSLALAYCAARAARAREETRGQTLALPTAQRLAWGAEATAFEAEARRLEAAARADLWAGEGEV